MAVQVTPQTSLQATREGILELVGRSETARSVPTSAGDSTAVVELQMQAIDTFVEMIRLRTAVADRDRRIATLTIGLRTWRDRAGVEQAERRREASEAREREREIISLLHQQMQVADAATAELERLRARPWWRRLLG